MHAVMTKETSLDDLGIAAATPVTRDDFDPLDNIDDIMQSQTSSESPQPVVTVLSQLKTDSVPNPPVTISLRLLFLASKLIHTVLCKEPFFQAINLRFLSYFHFYVSYHSDFFYRHIS